MKIKLLLLFTLALHAVFSQPTNISGVINDYTEVTGITGSDISVTSTAQFTVGDKVLLIQMQGAIIDETNAASFGTITSVNGAGNYEFASVCAINNGTDLVLNNVQRTYDINGSVQLIRVPVYQDALTSGNLSAQPWNGTTGGVLTFECTGTLELNHDIDVQGLGFRAGTTTVSPYACQWFIPVDAYFYDIATGEGAMKGEGIAKYIAGKTGGMGPQMNGGGGGNDHNSGGGGGSNAGAGGQGGERIASTTFTCSGAYPGLGGNQITYSNVDNRIYLGGGGGSGHENNAGIGTSGVNGGGMVIIKANEIRGNSHTVNADGAPTLPNANDGAGGGGAGGSVLLDVNTYTGSLNVTASGTDGGNVDNSGTSNCNGPGGGGGGGILWINQASLPANITASYNGGMNGITASTQQTNCTVNSANNATPGANGALVTDLVLFESGCSASTVNQSFTICEYDSMYLEGQWQNTAGVYTDTVQSGCCDSIYITTLNITTIDTTVLTSSPTLTADLFATSYQWLDCNNNFAAIPGETNQSFTATITGSYAVEIGMNGCVDTSDCYIVDFTGITIHESGDFQINPNPTKGEITISLIGEPERATIRIRNTNGKLIEKVKIKNQNEVSLTLDAKPGIYFVEVHTQRGIIVEKLVIE
jgi:hypothetical protein